MLPHPVYMAVAEHDYSVMGPWAEIGRADDLPKNANNYCCKECPFFGYLPYATYFMQKFCTF